MQKIKLQGQSRRYVFFRDEVEGISTASARPDTPGDGVHLASKKGTNFKPMIPINEIRVGNALSMDGKIVTLSGEFLAEILSQPQLLEKIEPILITEELLTKVGFQSLEEPGGWVWERVIVYKVIDESEVFYEVHFINDSEDRITLPQKTKYVHKLQNLYYEVTGVELPCMLTDPV